MSEKVFMGAEYPGTGITCDIVLVGEYDKVMQDATDHFDLEHEYDPDSQLIAQTIRDYNELADGAPHGCSYTS
ncbi:MAG: hypothetical protein KDC73_05555 [Ignavibacteriae bacterium]|nr:hypothetical protein [Ignavibacteriota bacterium]MCB0724147.1 hypothetical protein [Ignavibacteriota bacterium]MCB9243809.1 hypothetical protein [Ignavibacteriales bacterium]